MALLERRPLVILASVEGSLARTLKTRQWHLVLHLHHHHCVLGALLLLSILLLRCLVSQGLSYGKLVFEALFVTWCLKFV